MKNNDRSLHPEFILIDLVSLIISFVLSYLIKFGDFGFVNDSAWLPLLFILSLMNIVISLFANPYSGIFRRPYYEEIIRSLMLSFYNLLAAGIMFYVFKIGILFSRQMVLSMYILYFVISLAAKCTYKKIAVSAKSSSTRARRIPLFIVGESPGIEETVRSAFASDFEAYELKGICLTDRGDINEIGGVPVVGSPSEFPAFVLNNNIEEVLFAASPSAVPAECFKTLVSAGVGIHMNMESMLGFGTEDYEVDSVGAYRTLSLGRYSFTAGQRAYLAVKRFADIAISLLGMPFLVLAAAAVKLIYLASGDRSGIFYRQTRIGKNGREIKIYKFRTMVPDADRALAELLKNEKYKAEWDACQKLADDPRITRAGRILRKTSLDELPQLLNVLRGDMSLVGPRPLVAGELEAHGGMRLYQQVRPGITGWWGCNGRSNIDYRERLELEYYYIRNFSAYLDFLCILRTVLAVLKRKGAE